MKNIYRLSQEKNIGWDTYDSMVIIADSEKEAILLSYEEDNILRENPPEEFIKAYFKLEEPFKNYTHRYCSTSGWVFEEDIKIEYLGKADSSIIESKVVCASYNAG